MKQFLSRLYASAVELNYENIERLLERDAGARFLDLGCDDGELTLRFASRIGTHQIYGVEIVGERAAIAKAKGVEVSGFDLNSSFGYPSNSFDVIYSNQVIEHLFDTDSFLSEIQRILKPGGYLVVSTENGSSWCNIGAAVLGWQIFSLTNFSSKAHGIGNPLALHHGDEPRLPSWNHVRIFNIRGLREYLIAFGFNVEAVLGLT